MQKRTYHVNFSQKCGKIKLVNGINLSYIHNGEGVERLRKILTMHKPSCVGIYDIEHPYGQNQYFDFHCIFPDITADPKDECSYNFGPTDEYLAAIREFTGDIILRIGESRDTYARRLYLAPPPPELFAEVAVRILMHYNALWANGYKWNIKQVEIWSGADTMNNFSGDSLDYTILYRTAANAIKRAFPKVKVGGYTSLGFGAQNRVTDDEELRGAPDYAAEFLSGISKGEGEAPLDFFTWSAAPATPEELVLHSKYARLLLKEHAPKAKSIISSFTLAKHEDATAADYLAAMLVGEKCDLDAMLYKYTEACEAKEWADAFFSEFSGYGTLAEISDDYRGEIYALAAADADGGVALFATDKFSGAVELFTLGDTMRTFDITELSLNERKEYKRASVSGREIASGKVMFAAKPKSVYLLKFSK